MMTCVVFPSGVDFSDELHKVLTDVGLEPDPRDQWREVLLDTQEVHELEDRFRNANFVFPDLPEELQKPFLAFNLRVYAARAREILKDKVLGKLFTTKDKAVYGHDILLFSETSREDAVLADMFRPLREAA